MTYSETVDGFDVHIEFFQEYYLLETMIQARISVKNNSKTDIEFCLNSFGLGQFVKANSNSPLCLTQLRDDPADYFIDAIQEKELKKGETVVLQRAYHAKAEFFATGKEYEYLFVMVWDIAGKLYNFNVRIPVEVIDLSKTYSVTTPPAETEAETNSLTYVDPDVWYLTDELRDAVRLPVMREKYKNYAIEVPETYTHNFDGLSVTLNFFKNIINMDQLFS